MITRIVVLALAGVALLMGPAPVLAHHGAATFDTVGEITIKGTVTEWVWSNPHSVLKLDVKAEDGTVKHGRSPRATSPTCPNVAGDGAPSSRVKRSPC